jgi:hypothetical protein
MKYLLPVMLLIALTAAVAVPGNYDPKYVEIKTLRIDNEPYGVIKFLRKDGRIKVKYFASKNYNGLTVADQYNAWATNRNIIGYACGTYMTTCYPTTALPVGICINQGKIINNALDTVNLDALVIVYATGGVVCSNLDEGKLSITSKNGTKQVVNIRQNSYEFEDFKKWAQAEEATVFQTHLLAYEDKFLVKATASSKRQHRRMMAVCKLDNGDIVHYIINLNTEMDIYTASKKAFDYLKLHEEVKQIVFMINLDRGCQDVFGLYKPDGAEYRSPNFKGHETYTLKDATNALVYYYE